MHPSEWVQARRLPRWQNDLAKLSAIAYGVDAGISVLSERSRASSHTNPRPSASPFPDPDRQSASSRRWTSTSMVACFLVALYHACPSQFPLPSHLALIYEYLYHFILMFM